MPGACQRRGRAGSLGFQLFAGAVMVSHADVQLVEVGRPGEGDGLMVQPGDLLHGDQHGVFIAHVIVCEGSRGLRARSRRVRGPFSALSRSPDFSPERLSALFDPYT